MSSTCAGSTPVPLEGPHVALEEEALPDGRERLQVGHRGRALAHPEPAHPGGDRAARDQHRPQALTPQPDQVAHPRVENGVAQLALLVDERRGAEFDDEGAHAPPSAEITSARSSSMPSPTSATTSRAPGGPPSPSSALVVIMIS